MSMFGAYVLSQHLLGVTMFPGVFLKLAGFLCSRQHGNRRVSVVWDRNSGLMYSAQQRAARLHVDLGLNYCGLQKLAKTRCGHACQHGGRRVSKVDRLPALSCKKILFACEIMLYLEGSGDHERENP